MNLLLEVFELLVESLDLAGEGILAVGAEGGTLVAESVEEVEDGPAGLPFSEATGVAAADAVLPGGVCADVGERHLVVGRAPATEHRHEVEVVVLGMQCDAVDGVAEAAFLAVGAKVGHHDGIGDASRQLEV